MKIQRNGLELEQVLPTKRQIDELYRQLNSRRHTISHKSPANYAEHARFVEDHPYRAWFIVKCGLRAVGSVYLQYDNSIGLNSLDLLTEKQIESILQILGEQFPPLEALASVRPENFFLNVSSSDFDLQEKLIKIGLVEIQRSFVFEGNSEGCKRDH